MISKNTPPVDLRVRTLEFSKQTIQYIKKQPNDYSDISTPILKQLIRSATSIGANFAEAKNSGSKKDFRNKVLIASKEAAETIYWLKIFQEFNDSDALYSLLDEATEIEKILQSIVYKTKPI